MRNTCITLSITLLSMICASAFVTNPSPFHRPTVAARTTCTLHMVQTKSGGRPVSSIEQFRIEVLHDDPDDAIDSPEGNSEVEDNTSNTDFQPCPVPILVFFSAPWCGPCRLSNPVVREIIKQFVPRIDVVEVCTDDLPEVAEDAGVVSIPTIQIYCKGDLLDTIVGCVAKNVLASAVNKILEDLGLDDSNVSSSSATSDVVEESTE